MYVWFPHWPQMLDFENGTVKESGTVGEHICKLAAMPLTLPVPMPASAPSPSVSRRNSLLSSHSAPSYAQPHRTPGRFSFAFC